MVKFKYISMNLGKQIDIPCVYFVGFGSWSKWRAFNSPIRDIVIAIRRVKK